jgi:phosphoglycerate dehydrogenase-like enzyme
MALYEALEQKQIGGAVIDTWYVYPKDANDAPYPGNYPFHRLDNIIITPHMSGWTWGTIRRRQRVMAENIHRLEKGEPLLNIVRRGDY